MLIKATGAVKPIMNKNVKTDKLPKYAYAY